MHRYAAPTVLATLAVALLGAAVSAHAATLTVDVQQASATPGALMIALYDQASPWLKKPLRALRQVAGSGTTTVTLSDLPDGDYAVSLFVDVNGNGRLDTNALGAPTEPYGFSNDASGSYGPPTFDQARIVVQGDTRTLIRLP
jgi:uncharacterized protein (DUF2141 family)